MAQENKGCLVEVQRCEWMPRIGTETEDLSGNGATGKLQNGMTFDSELPEDAI